MKITTINKNNRINYPTNFNKTSFSLNKINFKGADSFTKSVKVPTESEFENLILNNEITRAVKLYDVSSKINYKIYQDEIVPLIKGEYKEQYDEFIKFLTGDKTKKLSNFASDLSEYLSNRLLDMPLYETRKFGNALSVIAEDNQSAQDVLDFLPSFIKMKSIGTTYVAEDFNKEWFNPFDYILKNNFVRISKEDTKNLSHGEIHKLIFSALNEAEENYKKTGGYTILKVDDIEKLMKENNPNPEIAWMKLITQCSLEDYHTISLMAVSKRKELAKGFDTIGRMGRPFVLEEFGITKDDVKQLKELQRKIQPLSDKIEESFKNENSQNVQLLRIIRKELNKVIEDNQKYIQAYYDLTQENTKENTEKLLELVDKITNETKEAEKENFVDTFKKIYQIFQPPQNQNITPNEINNDTKETIKKTEEIIENKVKDTVEPIKTSVFTKIKEFFKNNKKMLGTISIPIILGIIIFLIFKKRKPVNFKQQNNVTTTTLLKNISFNDFKTLQKI